MGGRRHVNWNPELADERPEPADVILVLVRDDNRVTALQRLTDCG